ncbi:MULTISPECIES: hypothetical protein [Lysinibacillus]|jgi:hypothetical protein|uniref:Uncharacterized protein n=1 Tax=Lysinibacillus fusiformis TaxID=28031 RepID=A0A1H9QC19_9BACI|nr:MULTISPECIES: hypothetical protein [Lysinibacillus]MDC6269908.1 hypothetical protein [Lysinibacillus sphaericus]MDN4971145.1 hypothetical protein [Lysinibacillus fusiformis]MED4075054.1 hypothetical protein [Lysinibacillus fusiformis]MED4670146.1 hypothetical protein [Lysinibacillus fusiformis]UXJ69225.1 hypothetical protein N5069_01495 [Lysinibacillus fusiformis]
MSPRQDKDGIMMRFLRLKVNIVITSHTNRYPALVTGDCVGYTL